MNQHSEPPSKPSKLDLYHTLVSKIHAKLHQQDGDDRHRFRESLEALEHTLSDWGAFSQKEVQKLILYLKRDLKEASEAIVKASDNNSEWRQWLKFDLEQVEQHTLEKLFEIADTTPIEWLQLQDELQAHGEFHTGEIKSIGMLKCYQCGEILHFKAPGHIPPCPACHGTVFLRQSDLQSE